jgi:catechol 2,3-dioxygenase-like lactoylglutathione lyase family enzyme
MPNFPRLSMSTYSHSFRAPRLLHIALCALCVLCVGKTASTEAQTSQRPKILGIGRVRIEGTITDSSDPVGFYKNLRPCPLGSFQAGAAMEILYALNDHQEIELVAGPRPKPDLKAPLPNNLSLVLFETSNIVALRDYLKSRQVRVSEVTADGGSVRVEGKSITGDPSFITMQDPDGHWIGFIQYKLPLRFAKQEGQISSRLIHAGFIVQNRPAMDHFYIDILGFRPYWHGGMKDDETTWVSLQVPDGSDWLEYMLYDPAGKDKHFLGVMNHIALGVEDIQAAKAQLLKNGAKLTEEPKLGRDGKWQLNVYDPDETRVEFMEFAPKEKPCCSEFTAPHPKP